MNNLGEYGTISITNEAEGVGVVEGLKEWELKDLLGKVNQWVKE